MDDVLKLITVTFTTDEAGVRRESRSSRTVFCRCDSVTRTEFFGAGRDGLNPAYVFTVFAGDYGGEELVEYHDEAFAVYRTYRADSDYIELYVQRKGGTNGKADAG